MTWKARNNVVIVAVIVFCLAINIYAIKPGHSWGDDFSMYLMQKDHILKGGDSELLTFSKFRCDYSNFIAGPNIYPWGYPVFLSFISAVFDPGIYGYVLTNVVLLSIFVFFVCLYFKDTLNLLFVVLLALVLSVNPVMFEMKDSVLSDIFAVLCAFVSLVLVEMSLQYYGMKRVVVSVFCAIFIFLAYFTRTQYVFLFPFVLLRVACDGFRRARLTGSSGDLLHVSLQLLILLAVCFGMYTFANVLFPQKSTYDDHLRWSNFLQTVYSNILYYFDVFTGSWLDVLPAYVGRVQFLGVKVYNVVGYFLLPAVIVGFYCCLKRDVMKFIAAVVGICIPLVYPYLCGLRLVLFCYPFYLWFVMLGLEHKFTSRIVSVYQVISKTVVLCAVVLFVSVSLKNGMKYNKPTYVVGDGPFKETSVEMFNYVEGTRQASTFAFFKARALNFFAGKLCATFNNMNEIDPDKIDYVILYKDGEVMDFEYADECDLKFSRVFSNSDFLIYRTKGADGQ